MVELIKEYWVEFGMGLLSAGLVGMASWSKKRMGKMKIQYDGMRAGTLAMLHDRLFQSCRFFIKKGSVDVDGLDNINELYKGYHAMGGNGTGTQLYEAVCHLPIKDE